jgi:hypothetical protein
MATGIELTRFFLANQRYQFEGTASTDYRSP